MEIMEGIVFIGISIRGKYYNLKLWKDLFIYILSNYKPTKVLDHFFHSVLYICYIYFSKMFVICNEVIVYYCTTLW